MSRVVKFKEQRTIRRKVALTFIVFFTLVLGGLAAADYSVNGLMSGDSRVRILEFRRLDDSYIVISIMNSRLYVCTAYIDRDRERFKKFINKLTD